MKPIRIPRRVDEPPHILLWSSDELAPMLLGLVVGVFIGKAFICFVAGLTITSLYKRFRDNHPDGHLLHIFYWAGFLFTNAKSMKNPFVRRYIP